MFIYCADLITSFRVFVIGLDNTSGCLIWLARVEVAKNQDWRGWGIYDM